MASINSLIFTNGDHMLVIPMENVYRITCDEDGDWCVDYVDPCDPGPDFHLCHVWLDEKQKDALLTKLAASAATIEVREFN